MLISRHQFAPIDFLFLLLSFFLSFFSRNRAVTKSLRPGTNHLKEDKLTRLGMFRKAMLVLFFETLNVNWKPLFSLSVNKQV